MFTCKGLLSFIVVANPSRAAAAAAAAESMKYWRHHRILTALSG